MTQEYSVQYVSTYIQSTFITSDNILIKCCLLDCLPFTILVVKKICVTCHDVGGVGVTPTVYGLWGLSHFIAPQFGIFAFLDAQLPVSPPPGASRGVFWA